MAHVLKHINWAMVQALYMQGVKNSEIAAKFKIKPCTLLARISRHRWNDQRRECVVMSRDSVALPAVAEAQSVSTRFREWFQTDAKKVLLHLEQLGVSSLEMHEIEKRQGIVKTIYGMMAEMLDWNGEASKPSIDSHLLARLLDEVESIREKKAESITLPAEPLPIVDSTPVFDAQLEQIPEVIDSDGVSDSEKPT